MIQLDKYHYRPIGLSLSLLYTSLKLKKNYRIFLMMLPLLIIISRNNLIELLRLKMQHMILYIGRKDSLGYHKFLLNLAKLTTIIRLVMISYLIGKFTSIVICLNTEKNLLVQKLEKYHLTKFYSHLP